MTFNPTFLSQLGKAIDKAVAIKAANLVGRVTHVVMGPYYGDTNIKDPYYKDPTDIGKITFQIIDSNQNRTSNSAGNQLAKPMNSSMKQLPVEGELVPIMNGPGIQMNDDKEAKDYYYLPPFSIWAASHHNAYPDLGDYAAYSNSTQRTYQQNQFTNQATNVSTTGSVNYPLGPSFPEKSHIKSLLPFPGDVIMEGRWGNSIRFGSTSATAKFKNTWSEGSIEAGNPITIIRNGQGRSLDETAWLPTVENINRDPSSIYLTKGQKIVIDDIQNNFSLASLGVVLESTYTNSIALQQALTSYESISPSEQDKYVSQNA